MNLLKSIVCLAMVSAALSQEGRDIPEDAVGYVRGDGVTEDSDDERFCAFINFPVGEDECFEGVSNAVSSAQGPIGPTSVFVDIINPGAPLVGYFSMDIFGLDAEGGPPDL